jgi:hypothetical protein
VSLNYEIRPISDRTWFRPASARKRSQFTASWTDTLNLLERELDHLDAKRLVMELDVREDEIRLDGQVRANARPSTDAVAPRVPRRGSTTSARSPSPSKRCAQSIVTGHRITVSSTAAIRPSVAETVSSPRA